jgi:hypothetical protein
MGPALRIGATVRHAKIGLSGNVRGAQKVRAVLVQIRHTKCAPDRHQSSICPKDFLHHSHCTRTISVSGLYPVNTADYLICNLYLTVVLFHDSFDGGDLKIPLDVLSVVFLASFWLVIEHTYLVASRQTEISVPWEYFTIYSPSSPGKILVPAPAPASLSC